MVADIEQRRLYQNEIFFLRHSHCCCIHGNTCVRLFTCAEDYWKKVFDVDFDHIISAISNRQISLVELNMGLSAICQLVENYALRLFSEEIDSSFHDEVVRQRLNVYQFLIEHARFYVYSLVCGIYESIDVFVKDLPEVFVPFWAYYSRKVRVLDTSDHVFPDPEIPIPEKEILKIIVSRDFFGCPKKKIFDPYFDL
jgi:hypothetical protein